MHLDLIKALVPRLWHKYKGQKCAKHRNASVHEDCAVIPDGADEVSECLGDDEASDESEADDHRVGHWSYLKVNLFRNFVVFIWNEDR